MRRIAIIVVLFFVNSILNAQPKIEIKKSLKSDIEVGECLTIYQNKKGKYGYRNSEGKIYIKAIFDEARDFCGSANDINYGAIVRYGNQWGIINQNGEFLVMNSDAEPIIINSKVGHVFTENGILFCGDSCWNVRETNGKYVCINKTNNELCLIRPNMEYTNYKHCIFNVTEEPVTHLAEKNLLDADYNIIKTYSNLKSNGKGKILLSDDREGVFIVENKFIQFKALTPFLYDNTKLLDFEFGEFLTRNEILSGEVLIYVFKDFRDSGCYFYSIGENRYELYNKKGKYLCKYDFSQIIKNNKVTPTIYLSNKDKMGIIDIDTGVAIPPIYEVGEAGLWEDGRYVTFEGADAIAARNNWYLISDYENRLYLNVQKSKNLVSTYQAAKSYMDNELLRLDEKIHYAEVRMQFERSQKEINDLDKMLIATLSPDDYISTQKIPDEFKKYISRANDIKKCRYLNKEVKFQTSHIYIPNESYNSSEDNPCVTIPISYNNTALVKIQDLTYSKQPNKSGFKFVKQCKLSDSRMLIIYDYIQYRKEETGMKLYDVVDIKPNSYGVLEKVYGYKNVYRTVDESLRYAAVINTTGEVEWKLSMPIDFDKFCVKGDEFFVFDKFSALCVDKKGKICWRHEGALNDVGRTIDGGYILVGDKIVLLDKNGRKTKEVDIPKYNVEKIYLSENINEYVLECGSSYHVLTVNDDKSIDLL